MMPEPEENRLDQSLRDKFEDFNPTPSAGVWAGVEQRLVAEPTPALRRRRRPLPLPFFFGLTALLAGLGGWLLPHGTSQPTTTAIREATIATKATIQGNASQPITAAESQRADQRFSAAAGVKSTSRLKESSPKLTNSITRQAASNNGLPSAISEIFNQDSGRKTMTLDAPQSSSLAAPFPSGLSTTASPATSSDSLKTKVVVAAQLPVSSEAAGKRSILVDSLPATLRPLVALERQTLVQLPSISTLAPGNLPADSRAALLTNLRTERAELFRLQRRTDSLLLALGDLPVAPPVAPAVAAAPAVDTAKIRPLAHRWSLLLTATPEQNTLNLQGPETDSLTALRRNHETGRAGLSAALTAEYKLTPRLSVGGGVGYTSFGADLRITNKITDVLVAYNTTTTTSTNVFTSSYQTHSIRVIQVPQLSPVFNGSGQVIRYDTVYVPRQDTVYTTTVQHDTTHTTRSTTTPTITKKETLVTKHLQPTYRFFTVPVLLRYRLTMGPGRWWADVAAGAQFQFFLGGTQIATEDGVNFRTETITAGNGPFRPLNLALSGSLALNYALTNRLSVSVAPSLRWQALSVYKPETGLIQQPTATGLMFGVRFGL